MVNSLDITISMCQCVYLDSMTCHCLSALLWSEVYTQCVSRVAAQMSQFSDGLGELGEIISRHPDTCQPLLVASHIQLTMAVLKRLYSINWSPEETVFYFEMYLAECECKYHGFCVSGCRFAKTAEGINFPFGGKTPIDPSFNVIYAGRQ